MDALGAGSLPIIPIGSRLNKGVPVKDQKRNQMRDIHFPHHRHQDALEDCNVCHDLFPAKAGSIAELKAQGRLKKNRCWKSISSPVTSKEKLPEKKPDRPLCPMPPKNRIALEHDRVWRCKVTSRLSTMFSLS